MGILTERDVSETFDRDPSEIVRARRMVAAALRAWGRGDEQPHFELAVSELVSNALLHGSGKVEVRLHDDGDGIRLEVADHGGGVPRLQPRSQVAALAGGWGLQFVDELSDEWGTDTDAERTRVWMVRHPAGHRGDGHGNGR